MKIKTLHILIPIIFLTLCVSLYFYYKPAPNKPFKCPESYTEDDADTNEYRNALIDWTSSFFEANPKAKSSDWSMAKLKLWKDNDCVIALERSKLSGNVSDLKPWELVDYEIQNSLNKTISNTN